MVIRVRGPVSNTRVVPNHSSARDYPDSVDAFIAKELSHEALIGPCPRPIFSPWMHVSPLMMREKRDTTDRRVIIDMTFPRKSSINSYIAKNTVCGAPREHALPTVDMLVSDLKVMGGGHS